MKQIMTSDDALRAAYGEPLETLHPGRMSLFQANSHWPVFERLRRESPVHYTPASPYGPYWSITKYNDIMAIETNHEVFSSAGGITLADGDFNDGMFPMFIAMDPPRHSAQRKTVMPAFASASLAALAPLIRERAGRILDNLPIGEPFDWVDKVSKELTAMTLATLFGMPQEDRRRLTRWSDVLTAVPGRGNIVATGEQKQSEMKEYFDYFTRLWTQRREAPPGADLISMLAHGAATRDMPMREYLGNIILLTVGGNDTTRNSITGSVYALHAFPDQLTKLLTNPSLIGSMVSEAFRWQTPLAHMRRTASQDVEFRGKLIRKGDKVVMWYVSGNRDDDVITDPNAFVVDRPHARSHLSFGFGIHRCIGNRVAEMQLKIIWEEIVARFPRIEVLAEPVRTYSNFVNGYESMTVAIPAHLKTRAHLHHSSH